MSIIIIVVFWWQIQVLKGKAMKNPDGTYDDWHEQKIFFGIAIADIFVAIPTTIAGITMILLNMNIGFCAQFSSLSYETVLSGDSVEKMRTFFLLNKK